MSFFNKHIFTGRVLERIGPIKTIKKDGSYTDWIKTFLICEGDYQPRRGNQNNAVKKLVLKFTDTMRKDSYASKLNDCYPGDIVEIEFVPQTFYLPGERYPSKEPRCLVDLKPDVVNILNTSERKMFENKASDSEFDGPEFKYEEGTIVEEKEEPLNDLPFAWFIPLLLPLAANLIL